MLNSKKFYVDLDLGLNSIKNVVIENKETAPDVLSEGYIFFNTTEQKIGYCVRNEKTGNLEVKYVASVLDIPQVKKVVVVNEGELIPENGIVSWKALDSDVKDMIINVCLADGTEIVCDKIRAADGLTIRMHADANIAAESLKAILI